jgi:hypothetical protein
MAQRYDAGGGPCGNPSRRARYPREFFFEVVIGTGLRAIGWTVLKVVTFGRYRGFQEADIILEGSLGFATTVVVGYGAYRWLFQG